MSQSTTTSLGGVPLSEDPNSGALFPTPTQGVKEVLMAMSEEDYQDILTGMEERMAPVRNEIGLYAYERFRYLQEDLDVQHLDNKIENLATSYHRLNQHLLTIKCARGEL